MYSRIRSYIKSHSLYQYYKIIFFCFFFHAVTVFFLLCVCMCMYVPALKSLIHLEFFWHSVWTVDFIKYLISDKVSHPLLILFFRIVLVLDYFSSWILESTYCIAGKSSNDHVFRLTGTVDIFNFSYLRMLCSICWSLLFCISSKVF